MSTKPIILRQHLRGSDSPPPQRTLNLSLGEQELSYTIILHQDQLRIENGTLPQSEGSAVIHTQNGSVCVEALKPVVSVQSIASGFDGKSANGIMLLQVSDANRRIYHQLHPGKSIFVGPCTISVVPEEHRNIPVSPAGYDSYREHVSQQVSQYQSPSVKAYATPVHYRAPSNFSSPTQNKFVVNQMETATDNRGSDLSLPKPSFAETIRDLQRNGAQSRDSHSEDPMSTENTFASALDVPATKPSGIMNLSFDQPCHGEELKPAGLTLTVEQILNEQREPIDQNVQTHQGNPIENEMAKEEEFHHALNSEETTDDDLERSDFISSTAISTPGLSQRKRRRLLPTIQDSSEEETQDSIRSNIIAQEPAIKHHESAPERVLGKASYLPEMFELSAIEAGHDEISREEPSLEIDESEGAERLIDPTIDETLEPLQAPKKSTKILFASSTSIKGSGVMMRFLKKQGVEEVLSVASCTALCVSKRLELKKTGKFIMAVLQGKSIITDDWVTQSAKVETLLDMEDFRANDEAREAEWGIVLDEVIKRNRHTTPKPFEGWTIAFTSAAKRDAGISAYNELREIALYAGAENCSTTLPKKPQEESQPTLIIACPNDSALGLLKGQWRCFSRDIIGLSSLRGKLDMDSDEFLVRNDPKTPKSGIKRKKQK